MSPGSPAAAGAVDSATRRSPALAEIGELVRYRALLKLLVSKIVSGTLPDPGSFTLAVLSSLGVLSLGWWTFTRKSDQFAYRL